MAYIKPNYPLKNGDNYLYPVTTADQVILSDGSRLEKDGKVVAGKLEETRIISLAGDVAGSVSFDGSNDVVINTSLISASNYYHVTFKASNWSLSAPYTQTVPVIGIKESDYPIIDVDSSVISSDENGDYLGAWALIGRVSTANGSVTAYCYQEKPKVDISVNIVVIK